MYYSKEDMVADIIFKQKAGTRPAYFIFAFIAIISIFFMILASSWWLTVILGVVSFIFVSFLIIGVSVESGNIKNFKKYAPFYDRGDIFIQQVTTQTNSPAVSKVKEDLEALVKANMLESVVLYEETGQIIIASSMSKTQAENFSKYTPFYNKGKTLISDIEASVNISIDTLRLELQGLVNFGAIKTPEIDEASNIVIIQTISPAVQLAHTGDSATDALVKEGEAAVSTLQRLRNSIPDAQIQEKIDEIIIVTSGIFNKLSGEPENYGQITHFAGYYLPKALKLLTSYESLSSSVQTENTKDMLDKINVALSTLVAGFKSIHDSLYNHKALDIKADIEMLDMMLKLDGINLEDDITNTSYPIPDTK